MTPNAIAFSSMALVRLGLDARTPERIGEVWIEKDARGTPTGIVTGSVTNYYSSDSFNHSLWRQIPFVQLDKAFAGPERSACASRTSGPTGSSPKRRVHQQVARGVDDGRVRLAWHAAEHRRHGHASARGHLEQLEAAARVFDVSSLHWLLVHAWFLESDQTRRYAQLGMNVTTSMAFTWGKGRLFRARMKPGVLADLVPLRRILDSGLVVAGGSDWGPKCAFKQIAAGAAILPATSG